MSKLIVDETTTIQQQQQPKIQWVSVFDRDLHDDDSVFSILCVAFVARNQHLTLLFLMSTFVSNRFKLLNISVRQHHHHHYPYGWGLDVFPGEDHEQEDYPHKSVKEVKHITRKKKTSTAAAAETAAAAAQQKREEEEHQEILRGIVQAYMDNLMSLGLE